MTKEEKAREYANQVYCHDTSNLRKEDAEEDFIAGAKWQAGQDRNKAFDSFCLCHCESDRITCLSETGEAGDCCKLNNFIRHYEQIEK